MTKAVFSLSEICRRIKKKTSRENTCYMVKKFVFLSLELIRLSGDLVYTYTVLEYYTVHYIRGFIRRVLISYSICAAI